MWHELAGSRIFITGGTGFFGKWLLESIAAANDRLGANVRATILSRDPGRFAAEVPHLAARPEFTWLVGDAASFTFPTAHFDYVLHFATASAAEVRAGGTATIMATLRGTERVLQFARSSDAKRLLFASSGAVYGRPPPELERIPEDFHGGPDLADPASGYGEMKRLAELMCTTTKDIECVIARGFSFVGPYLPLTDKFAVGGFIRDALAGGPIRIHGDGKPLRSYMYAPDLAIWLLTLLLRGRTSEPYNVGSDLAISLEELARNISSIIGGIEIKIEHTRPAGRADKYIPDTGKARTEFGLHIETPLSAALERSIAHAQGKSWKRQ